mgnify:CR=1 FL=1
MMNEQKLADLLQSYISAFKRYDLSRVRQCYQLPCALHTPDKIVYLTSELAFEQEFIQIFNVLQDANISDIKATKITFNPLENNTIDMCIDWVFMDDNDAVFTDFCAFYHLVKDEQEQTEQQYKMISVVSHELSNSVELPFSLSPKLLSGLSINLPPVN